MVSLWTRWMIGSIWQERRGHATTAVLVFGCFVLQTNSQHTLLHTRSIQGRYKKRAGVPGRGVRMLFNSVIEECARVCGCCLVVVVVDQCFRWRCFAYVPWAIAPDERERQLIINCVCNCEGFVDSRYLPLPPPRTSSIGRSSVGTSLHQIFVQILPAEDCIATHKSTYTQRVIDIGSGEKVAGEEWSYLNASDSRVELITIWVQWLYTSNAIDVCNMD